MNDPLPAPIYDHAAFDHAAFDHAALFAALHQAIRAIPPLWPLSASIAVNPFLGQASEGLAEAGARLARVAGLRLTMPRRWYRERLAAGAITDLDLSGAWAVAPEALRPADLSALAAALATDPPAPPALPTIADLAAEASAIDWPCLIAERLGAWAAGHFDDGQALWAAPRDKSAYAAWRAIAMHDLSPEIAGLPGFARHVADAPETASQAIARVVASLGLTPASLETYCHQLLMTLGGWAQYARYHLWRAEQAGGSDETLIDLLAIRLIWEEALYLRYRPHIAARWEETRSHHAMPIAVSADLVLDAILQDAAERAEQRALAATLTRAETPAAGARPALQAAFCIDVRSEIFRRALECTGPEIETLGFAGFFGLATAHRRFASVCEEWRLPALLTPTLTSCATGEPARDQAARIKARAHRAWGRFKLAAVSSFAFVEATGPVYIGKLIADALGLSAHQTPPDPPPTLSPALTLAERTTIAERVLRAMSLTARFARLVLFVGHGADVINNPHASALQCGACGGYSGEVNARLLATLLNDAAVREGLATRGIAIPADTLFLAALHDTTSDTVTLFSADHAISTHAEDVRHAARALDAAGALARSERARRLPHARDQAALLRRGRDWAETRPEWALAGCTAFIAAPRARTAGKTLDGRVFLHDYDWTKDEGFAVLELILTAPVVVASWISLQYYGATVAPDHFGAGNKLLHNVTGGIGVVEGNGGVLRAGLPWQSIHDGERLIHEPHRLSVWIEAPADAISAILRRHEPLRALFDNGWLALFAISDTARAPLRYAGAYRWLPLGEGARATPKEALSA